jgi:hypothetical protein
MTDLTGSDFGTSDGAFKATQRDDEVHFDLGFQNRKKKSAIYKNGTVTVDVRSPGPEATLPKNECAVVLNMVATCLRLPECNEGRIFDNFAMAGRRYFNRLEEMPVFTPRISIVFVPLFARAGHTSQSRLAAYFADIRMFRLTLIHGSTSANFVVLVDSGSSLPLASKVRRVVEVANDAPILEM